MGGYALLMRVLNFTYLCNIHGPTANCVSDSIHPAHEITEFHVFVQPSPLLPTAIFRADNQLLDEVGSPALPAHKFIPRYLWIPMVIRCVSSHLSVHRDMS